MASSSAAAKAAAAAASRPSPASTGSGSRVTLGLYRSLLRAARPFDGSSPPSSGRILSSLLHRTGIDHDDEHAAHVAAAVRAASARPAGRRSKKSILGGAGEAGADDDDQSSPASYREVHLPREYARDLSRPYRELQRTRWRHQRGRPAFSDDDDDDDDYDGELEGMPGGTTTPPHEVLFRGLLREALGGGPALMRFPSQVGSVSDGEGGRVDAPLRELIRREFRAGDDPSEWTNADLLSPGFDAATRVRTAFLSLRELNRKLRYAECHGLDLRRSGDSAAESSLEGDEAASHGGKGGGAAASRKAAAMASARRRCGAVGSDANRSRNLRRAARDVRPLPLSVTPTSSYLRPGTYLVAHPLVDGFFARSVIVLLDHTDEADGDDMSGSGRGGTYGVVVNKPVAPMDPSAGPDGPHGGRRCATMEEVIRTVPHGLRVAFGDAAVRNGGPVNAALQMIHTCSPELEERVKIGGNVLPMVELDAAGAAHLDTTSATAVSAAAGPQPSGAAMTTADAGAALDPGHAVYFQGDPIRAAQAVLSGDVDRTDVSFLVGASCWTAGQLESEVARGWWMPCRGPPRIALTGQCEHGDEWDGDDGDDDGDGAIMRRRGPLPPGDDLWLSMMCALGQEEGDLAHLLLATDGGGGAAAADGGEGSYDENGEPCDDF